MADSSSFEVRPLLLSRDEAAAGVERQIRLHDGREITVRIPAGVEEGTLLRLPGLAEDGDLFLRVQFVEIRVKRRLLPLLPIGLVVGVIALFIIVDAGSEDSTADMAETTTTTMTTTDYPTTTYYYPTTTTTEAEVTTVEAAPQDDTGVGECLKNAGTATSPNMLPSGCSRGAFQVVSRKTGTVDTGFCDGVAATTHSYVVEKYTVYTRGGVEYNRITNYAESYVFCLKQL